MSGFIDTARGRLQKERLPCQISTIDFIVCSENEKFTRVAIEQRANSFVVLQWMFKKAASNTNLTKRKMLETEHIWEAKEKLEEITTCLELEQWEFVSEEKHEVYNVRQDLENRYNTAIECMAAHEYQMYRAGQGTCKIRQIPRGFLCLMTIDPYGVTRIKLRNGQEVEAPESVKVMFSEVIQISGSRGFAGEGIFDGAKFYMTDVLYAHDCWVDKLSYEKRESLWTRYTFENGIVNLYTLKMHEAKSSAIGALLNESITALMIYDQNGQVAVSEYGARNVNVGGEPNKVLYDEKFKKIGVMNDPSKFDLTYLKLRCLHLNTSSLGLEGVYV